MADLRAQGLERIEGDLVLDRSHFAPIGHDPAAFDAEPLRPYNVGPDALLVNFKSVRFAFEPNAAGDAVDLRMEPPLPQVALGPSPTLVDGDCGNWRRSVSGSFVNEPAAAARRIPGAVPARLWRARLERRAARSPGLRPRHVRGLLRRGRRHVRGCRARRPGAAGQAVRHARVRAAPRRDPRRQQAVEQRDGAPVVPHARHDLGTAAGDDRRRARSRAPLARAAQARDPGLPGGQRLGPVAHRTRDRPRARAAARRGAREPRARGTRRRRSRSRRPTARSSGACATAAPPAGRCSRPVRSRACVPSRATCRTPAKHDGSWWRSSNHPNAARAQGALDFLADWTLRNAASYMPPRH